LPKSVQKWLKNTVQSISATHNLEQNLYQNCTLRVVDNHILLSCEQGDFSHLCDCANGVVLLSLEI
jgi:hypothetical protein